jgi:hypothetical protein
VRHVFIAPLLFSAFLFPLAAQNSAPPKLDYGFEQRVRNENWNNVLDFSNASDDERGQVRYRTRVWMKAPLSKNVDIAIGMTQETNEIFQPHTVAHIDEGFFDTAYIDIKTLFVKGLSLKFGRQNISKGDNFLYFEGDPWDGSRSLYVNAAVLGYERGKSKIEAIGIFDPRMDRFLPRINNKVRQLVEWNESALGLYYTDTHLPKTTLESYLFYKREFGDPRPASNPQFQPNRYVYTAGGRVARQLPQAFSLNGEFAGQWGAQRNGKNIRAWGGYGYVKHMFGAQKRHSAQFGYWGMSGSDPANPGTIGNWDPLFARWPKFSEGYLYTQLKEVGVGYWSNIALWQAEGVYSPIKPLSIRATFYQMQSYHPFPGSKAMFGAGTNRGQEYQLRADLTVNQHWKSHALYERHAPGSYYAGKDSGQFVRLEVIYTFTGRVQLGGNTH